MLDVRAIHKQFAPGQPVLRGVSLTVAAQEIVCLLGPSGCGKSTLLRIIAGLERPDAGAVWLNGADVSATPAHRRGIGLMFQDYALFPHLTVADNVAYGLRMQKMPAAQRRARVVEMLALVDLDAYANRAVDDLSGGEQQRVALARTLAPNPALLLLDEPVANLDRLLRDELVVEVRRILKQLHVTAIFVTHDQEEAFALADRIAVMHDGQIEQIDTPVQLYRRPANTFVAGFLGFHNLLLVLGVNAESGVVHTTAGDFFAPVLAAQATDNMRLLIPPDAAVLDDRQPGLSYAPFAGRVVTTTFRGSTFRLEVIPAASHLGSDCVLQFEFRNRGRDHLFAAGEVVMLWLDRDQMTLVREL
jgi:ABC-type Fe3+/spermidine/putrescine transport system ATPase subunit